ncbi:MAG: competence-damage inducible protein CinA [uncultured bacterium]|nr:MAG: competence-damage inducible protein CinA [uncultured bacterium]
MSHTIQKLSSALGAQLKKRQWKLVTAESCTGGGLAYFVTHVAGSSDWFERGFVTYSNLAKEELLGVKAATLRQYGAVSEETAREMAEGALRHSKGDVSIAITGIAGPSGGTVEKPVGTVWFGLAGNHAKTKTSVHVLSGNREKIREQSIQIALEKLLQFIA